MEILAVAEITFPGFPPGTYPIVNYHAKWHEGSWEDQHTVRVFPPPADPQVQAAAKLAQLAVAACGLDGFARVDLRCDALGRPRVLEVNANPCLSPQAGFLAAAHYPGLSATQVVAEILRAAGWPCV